jgi:hypothetical protein
MAQYLLHSLDKPELKPYQVSPTLKNQIHYFTEGGVRDPNNPNEYLFPLERTSELLDDGVFYVVSPLDDQNQAEIEITDEQEDLLEWLVSNAVERVRVEEV